MAQGQSTRTGAARLKDRYFARRAARARPATGFVSQPEPRTTGQFARGRQLLAGNFRFGGHLIEGHASTPWDIDAPSPAFAEALHGFGWLDDLAAVGDGRARETAQAWVLAWIERFGAGRGPGWTPDLAGRRLIRWTCHALLLLRGQDKDASEAFYRSCAQQTIFLSHRWRSAAEGLPRFEALTGMIYAALSLTGMERHLEPALSALERDCAAVIGEDGGVPTRNPEELLDVFTLLGWAAAVLRDNDRAPGPNHAQALSRMAPTLRALRHADGGLARFHGGDRGIEGRLDQALSEAGDKTAPGQRLYMGFARLSAGRSTVIVDAAPPPAGYASRDAHASTLAFELTSGRRPLIVSCGAGAQFGEDWHRAGRATPSHSTLGLDGRSSSHVGAARKRRGQIEELLADHPCDVPWDMTRSEDALRLEAGHDGWRRTHGLTHARTLDLQTDGRMLVGEDILTTLSPEDEALFDRALDDRNLQGVPYAVRFHLHPDVNASLDMNGSAVSMGLPSGEIWILRIETDASLAIEPSVYFDSTRLTPRATSQVVLSGRMLNYACRIRWALSKAQDTPIALRDTAPSDDWPEDDAQT